MRNMPNRTDKEYQNRRGLGIHQNIEGAVVYQNESARKLLKLLYLLFYLYFNSLKGIVQRILRGVNNNLK